MVVVTAFEGSKVNLGYPRKARACARRTCEGSTFSALIPLRIDALTRTRHKFSTDNDVGDDVCRHVTELTGTSDLLPDCRRVDQQFLVCFYVLERKRLKRVSG